jgi:hypothetical protein
MHLFGRKKKETAAAPETAAASIAKLKDAESVLSKRQAVMQHKVDQVAAIANQLLCQSGAVLAHALRVYTEHARTCT